MCVIITTIYFQYTRKEIEWYGLTYKEACKKWIQLNAKQSQPLKIQYRSELIAKLKENKIKEAENVNVVSPEETYVIMYIIFFRVTISKFTHFFSQEFLVKQTESFLQNPISKFCLLDIMKNVLHLSNY